MLEQRSRPLIIAHRGASAFAPENTMAAFRLAIEQGAHGIEFDVRLSKDGQPVVIHDATLERTGRLKAKVGELTGAELASVDIGTWFDTTHPAKADPKFRNETVPSLAGTLEALKSYRGLIYIELKCKESEVERLARSVCELISGSPLLPQIIVKSFKLSAIPRIHFGCPPVKTAALFAPKIMRYLPQRKAPGQDRSGVRCRSSIAALLACQPQIDEKGGTNRAEGNNLDSGQAALGSKGSKTRPVRNNHKRSFETSRSGAL